jgi:TniQ
MMNPELLWRNEWFQDGESPWSVFQKIQLLNRTKSNELLLYMGNENIRKRKKIWQNRSLGNLWSMEDLDDEVLRRNLLTEVKVQNQQLKNWMINRLNVSDESCWHKERLQFCPLCLSEGYHSLIHQLRLLYVCPFHNEPLRTSCERCGAKYHFNLYEENMAFPFVCNCGHSYLTTFEYVHLHKLFSEKGTRKEIFNTFLDQLNAENETKHFYPKDLRYKQYANPFDVFLSFQKKGSKGKGITLQLKPTEVTDFAETVIPDQRAVFKSIARQIRKKFLKNHRTCLKEMKHGLLRKGVCCHALAYLNWRKDIEGDYSYFDVDRGLRKNVRGNHSSSFYTHVHEGFLDDIVTWMDQQLPKDNGHHLNTLQWVLNRVYPLLVWFQFIKWTKAVEAMIHPDNEMLIVKKLPFPEVTDLPFFLLSYKKDNQILSFHRDLLNVQIENHLYCYKEKKT